MVNIPKVKALAKQKGMKLKYICTALGYSEVYLNDVARGRTKMSDEKIHVLAAILMTSYEYLTDQTDDPAPTEEWIVELAEMSGAKEESSENKKTPGITPNADIISVNKNIYMIPQFENVSAGFGTLADDHITDYIPMYFSSPAEAKESIFITVRGDSMFPKIEDGDSVLVHKQESVDSGTIAVLLIDEDDALVKKMIYGEDWIELQSINPMYPPMRFEGADVLRVRVLGAVKKIIKSV